MVYAIVGSRSFNDYGLVKKTMAEFSDVTKIVSGGAKGADFLGHQFAVENQIPVEIFPAEWKKYGRAAGPIRNKLIIAAADVVVAFWDGKSSGTKNSIDLAKMGHKKLKIVIF